MIKNLKLNKIIVLILLCFTIFIPQYVASAAQTINMNYDGKNIKYTDISYKLIINDKEIKSDFPGIVFNKTVMFPLRAVFEAMGATVIWNSKTQIMDITYSGTKLQIKNNDANVKINSVNNRLRAPAKKINDRLIVGVDLFNKIKGLSCSVDNKNKSIKINSTLTGLIQNITSITSGDKDTVILSVVNQNGYQVTRQTNPNGIIVDFKNVKTSDKFSNVKTTSKFVTGISCMVSPNDQNSTRVVIGLNDVANYKVEQVSGGLKIYVEKPLNLNFFYVNNQDRIYFALNGIKLASVGSTVSYYFTEEYPELNKYIMTIPTGSSLSFQEGITTINDPFVNTVEIYRDKETNDIKIIFNTKKQFKFYTTFNETLNRTEINLLTPAAYGEKLVVIDAGHGGVDPGAKSSINEKDINLAIALKLEKLLEQNNIKTFMLRQDDTFVGLYDRPYIANALNATLFLSIHNNAIDSSKVSGTETLYFPEAAGDTSFTGKKFASLLQDSLINNLKTVNRKTVERPGLVVLKYTKMPSALAEVGFVTNPTEAANLKSEAYQQKAAQALFDAIVKGLEQIELKGSADAAN